MAKFKSRGGHVAFDLKQIQPPRSITLEAPATVRAVVNDQPHRTIIHLLNLNLQKLTSFTDKVTPAENVHLSVKVPFKHVYKVTALTPDTDATKGELIYSATWGNIEITIPRLSISTIVVVE